MKIALYARVSTKEQDTQNQIRILRKWAKKAGHKIVEVYSDDGVSGAKGRDQRPQFDAMLKAAVRREFDLVAAWSVDRLGRSLQHLAETLAELHSVGCGLYLHQQALDTTTPAGRAMFQMCGVFAEFERAMISERVLAGLAKAATIGHFPGRPPISDKKVAKIRAMRKQGYGIRKTAKALKCGVSTIQRLEATPP